MFIPFGEFAPDQAVFGQQSSSLISNLVPLNERSYGPMAGFSAVTNALNARCQGAASFRASDGTIHVFAGDATKLYKLNSDGVTWNDVTKSATTYTTPADGRWYFVQMGNRIVATNYTDAIQTYVIGSSALFADLSAGAPKARFIAVVKGFLVAADTWDASSGYKQNRIWWADANDPTNWPTIGSAAAAAAQSDYQDIQDGGQINGVVGGCGGRDGVVILQSAIVGMDYVGGAVVFSFLVIERGRGTTIPTAVINVGPFAGYIGEEGFMLFDGARSTPIGAGKVDRFFFAGGVPVSSFPPVDQTQFNRICTAYDANRKLIFWAYPISGTSAPTLYLVYNWQYGRWGYAGAATEFIFTGYTAGYTLDGLDSVSTSLDALPYSLDSTAWMGGRPLIAGFSAAHKFGYFNGSNLTATARTGEITGPNSRRMFVQRLRPVCDAPPANIVSNVYYRADQNAGVTAYDLLGTLTSGADGRVPIRLSTRYARFEIQVASGVTWNHMQGVEVESVGEGER